MKKLLPAILACLLICPNADAGGKRKGAQKKVRKAKPTYYYNRDGTITEQPAPVTATKKPSAYKGDDVPENDGQQKNAARNINYNSSQPLPANNGK
jgi:hypothetical protein